jgi:hypothetical protein
MRLFTSWLRAVRAAYPDRGVWLFDKTLQAFRQPMVPPRLPTLAIPSCPVGSSDRRAISVHARRVDGSQSWPAARQRELHVAACRAMSCAKRSRARVACLAVGQAGDSNGPARIRRDEAIEVGLSSSTIVGSSSKPLRRLGAAGPSARPFRPRIRRFQAARAAPAA